MNVQLIISNRAVNCTVTLNQFKDYYNYERAHSSLNSEAPYAKYDVIKEKIITVENYRWKTHVNGLFQLPIAA